MKKVVLEPVMEDSKNTHNRISHQVCLLDTELTSLYLLVHLSAQKLYTDTILSHFVDEKTEV